jgi:hypothetical protein
MFLPLTITGLAMLGVMCLCVFAAHIPGLRELTGAAPLEDDKWVEEDVKNGIT